MKITLKEGFARHRILQGHSLATLAYMIGRSPGLLQQLESGEATPSPTTAKLLAEALALPFDTLFELQKRKTKKTQGEGEN